MEVREWGKNEIEESTPPHERQEEGPLGADDGFTATGRALRPIYHVTAITHRDRPILPVAIDDLAIALSLTRAAEIVAETRRSGFPARSAFCPPEVALSHWPGETCIREWPKIDSPEVLWPAEIEKIVRDWRVYGYRGESPE